MSLNNWEEQQFDKIFDQTITHIERLREHDESFTLDRLRGMLETEYVNQGNDWVGRGEVGNINSEAMIAAYQQKIAEWEKESE